MRRRKGKMCSLKIRWEKIKACLASDELEEERSWQSHEKYMRSNSRSLREAAWSFDQRERTRWRGKSGKTHAKFTHVEKLKIWNSTAAESSLEHLKVLMKSKLQLPISPLRIIVSRRRATNPDFATLTSMKHPNSAWRSTSCVEFSQRFSLIEIFCSPYRQHTMSSKTSIVN